MHHLSYYLFLAIFVSSMVATYQAAFNLQNTSSSGELSSEEKEQWTAASSSRRSQPSPDVDIFLLKQSVQVD